MPEKFLIIMQHRCYYVTREFTYFLSECNHLELWSTYAQDKPVGTGDGVYHDRRLFQAKLKHASLLPLIGLMREKEFLCENQSRQSDIVYEDFVDG